MHQRTVLLRKTVFLQRALTKLLTGTALVSLASCSGSNGETNPFRTSEFNNSTGLETINAAEGYAGITGPQGGEGVTIAIVDDGIDEDHPELDDNIALSLVFDDEPNLEGEHGTAVASVAAAERGNGGIQGVAFNADLVAYQAGRSNPDDLTQIILDNDAVAAAIRDAGSRADIINMSFGFPLTGPILTNTGEIIAADSSAVTDEIEDAMADAAASGALMVVAAGNSAGSLDDLAEASGLPPGTLVDIGPDYPAQSADAGFSSSVIAVVALEDDDDLADFSNSCLGVEARCIAAPGTDITVAEAGTNGTLDGVDGTSFSAPLVSGSAAVVQAAFPGISPTAAGQRLLDTADDIGAVGIDSTFGTGRLDLENALSPQGNLTVSTSNSVDGERVELSETRLSLGTSMAMGEAGEALLKQAVVFDNDGFPFALDLNDAAEETSRSTGLAAFIGSSDRQTSVIAGDKTEMALVHDETALETNPALAAFSTDETSLDGKAEQPQLKIRAEISADVDVFFGFNGASTSDDALPLALTAEAPMLQPATFLAPFDQLAGAQTGGGTRLDLGAGTSVTVASFAATDESEVRTAAVQKIELTHRTFADATLRLGYGFLREDGGFLGSETEGAFGEGTSNNSHFLNLSLSAPLSDDVSLFGAYNRGLSEANGDTNGLIGDYSALHSEAFGIGVAVRNVASRGDGVSLMVGQPLRVDRGTAHVSVATGRTEDGTVLQEDAKLDLSPDGREMATEMVYSFALGGDQNLTAGSFLRINPDHDENAAPDLGIGLNYRLSF